MVRVFMFVRCIQVENVESLSLQFNNRDQSNLTTNNKRWRLAKNWLLRCRNGQNTYHRTLDSFAYEWKGSICIQLGRAQPRVTKFLIHLPELKSRQCVARLTRILGPTWSLDSKTSPQNIKVILTHCLLRGPRLHQTKNTVPGDHSEIYSPTRRGSCQGGKHSLASKHRVQISSSWLLPFFSSLHFLVKAAFIHA